MAPNAEATPPGDQWPLKGRAASTKTFLVQCEIRKDRTRATALPPWPMVEIGDVELVEFWLNTLPRVVKGSLPDCSGGTRP